MPAKSIILNGLEAILHALGRAGGRAERCGWNAPKTTTFLDDIFIFFNEIERFFFRLQVCVVLSSFRYLGLQKYK